MPAAPDRLPTWTWWLPLPLLHLATWLSLGTQFSEGAALWHLPFALGLVMTLWWGPRVLPLLYLNSLLSIPLWGLDWRWAPLYAVPETLGVALAWWLCRLRPVDPALPFLRHLVRFMLYGVLLALVPVAIGVQFNLWLSGHLPTLSLNLPLIGVMMLCLALVWGYVGAICGATLSSLMVLILPLLRGLTDTATWLDPQRLELHFGVLLFMLASLMVGRALSDLRQSLARSAQVQQQLALANLALEASSLGVIIADARQAELPLIYCNPSFERITGYSRKESLGRNWSFLLGGDHRQQGLARLQHAVQEGQACDVVLRNYRKDGEQFWNEFILAPMRDDQGISHFVALLHDVSAREHMAQQVRSQSDELLRQSYLFSQTEHIANLGGWVLNLPAQDMNWSEGCFRIYELDPKNGTPNLDEALNYMD